MNKFLLFILTVAISLGLIACGPSKKEPRAAADGFFLLIGESQFETAYESTAFAFQAQTSFKSFQAIAKELGLSSGKVLCRWTEEETKDREVKLKGAVKSAGSPTVPLTLTLVLERGEWRVFSLLTRNDTEKKDENRFSIVGKGSAFTSSANQEMPSPKLIRSLVVDSLLLFNNAIQEQSFADFYSKVSRAWQAQLTEGQLKRAFQPFVDSKVDIHDIRNLEPIFTQDPQVNSDGILVLLGYYDTKPHRTVFNLRFIYELPYWKLYGVEVQIQD